MEFKDSNTFKNLQNAFEIELMSSTSLELSADTAIKDGYIEIANNFKVAARNDFEHARIWLRQLNQGTLPDTSQNLISASQLSNSLGNGLYLSYSRTAQDEGYDSIASLFNGIANIELNHQLRFNTLYDELQTGELSCKPVETLWICMICGNILSGLCAPLICPICKYPQGYYRPYDRNTNL